MLVKYILILVDGKWVDICGMWLNSDGLGIEQGWLFLLVVIECIEVVCGLMLFLYGLDVMGGVINVIICKVGKEWYGIVCVDVILQEDFNFGDIY